jgi:hypothetical protein
VHKFWHAVAEDVMDRKAEERPILEDEVPLQSFHSSGILQMFI